MSVVFTPSAREIFTPRDLRRNAPAVRGIGVIVYLLSEEMDSV
jgi:hypothetical protein